MDFLKEILGEMGSKFMPHLRDLLEWCREEYLNALEHDYPGLDWLHQTKKAQGDEVATKEFRQ